MTSRPPSPGSDRASGPASGPGSSPAAQTSADPDRGRSPALDPDLAALADAHGVATAYRDFADRTVAVAPGTVRRVLGLLGVDATDPASALGDTVDRRWLRLAPPAVVVRAGAPAPVQLYVPVGVAPVASVLLAGGKQRTVQAQASGERRVVAGTERAGWRLRLPAGLPLGDHRLHVSAGRESADSLLVVAPDRVPLPAGLTRAWGWMVQLYAVRSARSWGMGDYADLAELACWSASRDGGDAGVLLVNPLHAPAPTLPQQDSPYYPSSRRFASPLYLRPEDLPEYALADAATRAEIAALRAGVPVGPRIERDAVWRAKRSALELLFPLSGQVARAADALGLPGPSEAAHALGVSEAADALGVSGAPDPAGPADLPDAVGPADAPGGGAGVTAGADGREDFAVWSALADEYGPDWRNWPQPLRSGDRAAARAAADSGRVAFHRWLQDACDEQLRQAQRTARAAGMPIGVVHDLAVGVDPGGADAWAMQDVLAIGASVGAPPDSFNQQGQNWGLPPWRPDQLAETGYAPFRAMVRAVLHRGGGLRVDHVMGLFRLWWVPLGASAADGTYVRYDADAMLGVLALEAARAGALVVGEDLGTVEPAVAASLTANGILGSSVLWFERDDGGRPLRPGQWRELTMASITTHDLPTAAGYLAGEHVRVRAELGQLGRPVAEEEAEWRQDAAGLLGLLRSEGLLAAPAPAGANDRPAGRNSARAAAGGEPGDASRGEPAGAGAATQVGTRAPHGPDGSDVTATHAAQDVGGLDTVDHTAAVVAMHAVLGATPARVVLASLGDAVGDLRQPNLPGTTDQYPNWCLPVADRDGRPISLEELKRHPGVLRTASVLSDAVTRPTR